MFLLLNVLLGIAKLAIYKTRKARLVNMKNENALFCFKGIVSARIKLEHAYHVNMGSLPVFEDLWCNGGVLCKCVENEVHIFCEL